MEASGVGASHSGDQGQKQRPSPSKHREHRGVWVVQKLMRIERESSSGVTRGLIKENPSSPRSPTRRPRRRPMVHPITSTRRPPGSSWRTAPPATVRPRPGWRSTRSKEAPRGAWGVGGVEGCGAYACTAQTCTLKFIDLHNILSTDAVAVGRGEDGEGAQSRTHTSLSCAQRGAATSQTTLILSNTAILIYLVGDCPNSVQLTAPDSEITTSV